MIFKPNDKGILVPAAGMVVPKKDVVQQAPARRKRLPGVEVEPRGTVRRVFPLKPHPNSGRHRGGR